MTEDERARLLEAHAALKLMRELQSRCEPNGLSPFRVIALMLLELERTLREAGQ